MLLAEGRQDLKASEAAEKGFYIFCYKAANESYL